MCIGMATNYIRTKEDYSTKHIRKFMDLTGVSRNNKLNFRSAQGLLSNGNNDINRSNTSDYFYC